MMMTSLFLIIISEYVWHITHRERERVLLRIQLHPYRNNQAIQFFHHFSQNWQMNGKSF